MDSQDYAMMDQHLRGITDALTCEQDSVATLLSCIEMSIGEIKDSIGLLAECCPTRRERIAVHMMASLVSRSDLVYANPFECAKEAVRSTDALLNELEK